MCVANCDAWLEKEEIREARARLEASAFYARAQAAMRSCWAVDERDPQHPQPQEQPGRPQQPGEQDDAPQEGRRLCA